MIKKKKKSAPRGDGMRRATRYTKYIHTKCVYRDIFVVVGAWRYALSTELFFFWYSIRKG